MKVEDWKVKVKLKQARIDARACQLKSRCACIKQNHMLRQYTYLGRYSLDGSLTSLPIDA